MTSRFSPQTENTSIQKDSVKGGSLLEAALEYEQHGFSIIPVRQDKKPYIQWKEFQGRKATPAEIEEWWREWPDAMIGIVTGKVSDLFVVDCDSQEGYEAIEEHLPDSLEVPMVRTPRDGWHLYFRYPGHGLTIGAGVVPGVDFRGESGYVIAPPSVNGNGKAYAWQDGLGIFDVSPAALPEELLNVFINNNTNTYIDTRLIHADSSSPSPEMFRQGRRDEDLFHIAYSLYRGEMPENEIRQVIVSLGKNCTPPFPEHEIEAKLQSARKRYQQRDRNIAEEVRVWVLDTNGHFTTTDIHRELQLATRERKAANAALRRLREEGLIEPYGAKNGGYRKIVHDFEVMDYKNAPTEEFDLKLPLGIDGLCKIYPGNVIVVAGAKSAGKTAFLLNVVKDNMDRHQIVYMNSEMGESELRVRLEKFEGMALEDWHFTPISRHGDWADLITPEPKIFIIDYLELPSSELHRVADEIRAIHEKLKDGICIIAIQKPQDRDLGLGKTFSIEKARLYLALNHGKIKIVDAKAWKIPSINPRGKSRAFKLAAGSKFLIDGHWEDEDET